MKKTIIFLLLGWLIVSPMVVPVFLTTCRNEWNLSAPPNLPSKPNQHWDRNRIRTYLAARTNILNDQVRNTVQLLPKFLKKNIDPFLENQESYRVARKRFLNALVMYYEVDSHQWDAHVKILLGKDTDGTEVLYHRNVQGLIEPISDSEAGNELTERADRVLVQAVEMAEAAEDLADIVKQEAATEDMMPEDMIRHADHFRDLVLFAKDRIASFIQIYGKGDLAGRREAIKLTPSIQVTVLFFDRVKEITHPVFENSSVFDTEIMLDPGLASEIWYSLFWLAVVVNEDHPFQMEIKITKNKDWIQVDFADNTKGISLEELQHIFQPGFEIARNVNRRISLNRIEEIISLADGSIEIVSKVEGKEPFRNHLKNNTYKIEKTLKRNPVITDASGTLVRIKFPALLQKEQEKHNWSVSTSL